MHGGELFLRFITLIAAGIFHVHRDPDTGGFDPYSPYNPQPLPRGDRGKIGGYVSLNCPTGQNSSDGHNQCYWDCRGQHGTIDGHCGDWQNGDYNCYCGESTGRRHEWSLQCGADTPDFREVCEVDCKCNHAATGGTCNFETKACICHNVGSNLGNAGCPYDTIAGITSFFREKLHLGNRLRQDPLLSPYVVQPRKWDTYSLGARSSVFNWNLDSNRAAPVDDSDEQNLEAQVKYPKHNPLLADIDFGILG